ncbi:MAG: hypothetical protein ACYC2H_10010 [Thermoplasmatota archaeon]
MDEPLTLQHVALHLAKYAGELAAIAEHLDHPEPEKRTKARRLAKKWLFSKRGAAVAWCDYRAEELLQAVAHPSTATQAVLP